MSDQQQPDGDVSAAAEVGEAIARRGWTLAVAESLTGGLLDDCFARLPDASEWFRGGVVAYDSEVKRGLLSIGDAEVVSEDAATAMASSVAALFGADVAVAVTGVGGPDPQDGLPPGTVWLAVSVCGSVSARLVTFDGEAADIVRATCEEAMAAILAAIEAYEDVPRAVAS